MYFWNVKCVVKLLILEKSKLSFAIGSITVKGNIEISGKETEKYRRNVFMIIIVRMVFQELMIRILLFLSNVRHEQLKERETFWQHRLKTIYPLSLNEKEEYLYQHTPYMRVRQSIMKEFWLSSSFTNFSVINLFKFVVSLCACIYLVVLHLRQQCRHFYSD